jgi:hypothetical protein
MAHVGRMGRMGMGRIPWPPRRISGEEAQARTSFFSGHNEGATKCTGARAPRGGRAQSPVRRNPNPQTTEHEAARERLAVEVLYFSKAIGGLYRFP